MKSRKIEVRIQTSSLPRNALDGGGSMMSFACSTIESRSQKHEDIDPCETATGKTEYLAFGPDKNIETQINLL